MKIYNVRFETIQGESMIVGENNNLKTLICPLAEYNSFTQVLTSHNTQYIVCSFADEKNFIRELDIHKLKAMVPGVKSEVKNLKKSNKLG